MIFGWVFFSSENAKHSAEEKMEVQPHDSPPGNKWK